MSGANDLSREEEMKKKWRINEEKVKKEVNEQENL